MKARNCFVSNSSSSSFVVSIDPKISCACDKCHRKDVDFLQVIEEIGNDFSSDSTCICAFGAEDVISELKSDHWTDDDDPEGEQLFQDSLNQIRREAARGKNIAFIRINNGDIFLKQEFDAQLRIGKIKELISFP